MRGKAFWGIHAVICQGITPAYAGKSMYQILFDLNTKDHPRLCGEKVRELCDTVMTLGSPPPMRGKVRIQFTNKPQNRITPAYAGKSSGLWNRECQRKDHPRLCGEKNSLNL